ncbi:MAG: hypothetical protein ACI93G_001813, partial [Hyphomonas sp.]
MLIQPDAKAMTGSGKFCAHLPSKLPGGATMISPRKVSRSALRAIARQ